MAKVRKIGFRTSWMGDEPEVTRETEDCTPKELRTLRTKIAQMVVFIGSDEFAKMKAEDRMKAAAELVELNEIECGYSAAVKGRA